jgi:hypothetical protein
MKLSSSHNIPLYSGNLGVLATVNGMNMLAKYLIFPLLLMSSLLCFKKIKDSSSYPLAKLIFYRDFRAGTDSFLRYYCYALSYLFLGSWLDSLKTAGGGLLVSRRKATLSSICENAREMMGLAGGSMLVTDCSGSE